jgi:hypothetical protein
VSDVPPAGFPPDSGQQWGPPPPTAFKRPSRWPTFVAIAIALIGVAVGFVGWFRPVPQNNPPPLKAVYTAQQTADAKAHVCAAYSKFERALEVAKAAPRGNDETAHLAESTNLRQVFDVGSRYLATTLAEEPAAPADLAAAVRKEASSLRDGVMGYLDGLPNSDPQMKPLVDANSEASETIRELCK